ncbi:MAG: hypothetical protein BWK78_07565 [Thiotrichaceae bacterium IS1]|nr:MAG: hypothetical protein BWK78_07565 [Thiotrichaceae bacterium IS1]
MSQHLEYFAFGETFVEESSNTQRTPYGFTGKEFDEETGLYYFGARYYDARTSVWASVDPILDEYLPTGDKEKDKQLPGMGGVFNTVNLNLYHYAGQNPVKYVDPDGHFAIAIPIGYAVGVAIVKTVAVVATGFVALYIGDQVGSKIRDITKTETIPKIERPEGVNVMRLQLQTGKKTPFGLPIVGPEKTGVTKSSVWAGLSALYAETLATNPGMAKSKEFQSAIIDMSKKVKNVQGGVTQGGNILRTEFQYQGKKYRIDLENIYGHNLRE